MNPRPLVTIGIPTYNRSRLLTSAIQSGLDQDYPNLELLISDNSSTDDTPSVCRAFAQMDNRVRYVRQAPNVGAMANFSGVLREAKGQYFMWLSDDDCLASTYVTACMDMMLREPSTCLVAGAATFVTADGTRIPEPPVNVFHADRARRVVQFYNQLGRNSVFYGIARVDRLRSVPPLREEPAGDWLFMASMAFLGCLKTTDTTTIIRSFEGGSNVCVTRLPQTPLVGRWLRFVPLVAMPAVAARDILRSPLYECLTSRRRIALATRVFALLLARFTVPKVAKRELIRVVTGMRTSLPAPIYASIRGLYRRACAAISAAHRGWR